MLYTYLTRTFDRFHLVAGRPSAPLLLVAPLLMAVGAGVGMAWCLVVLSLTPWVTVVGYELRGHEHNARVFDALADDVQPEEPG